MAGKSEGEELNEILRNSPTGDSPSCFLRELQEMTSCDEPISVCGSSDKKPEELLGGFTQWSTSDSKRFIPTSRTQAELTPGVYDILHSNTVGTYFEKIPVLTVGLLRFPETNSERVVSEIQSFWKREHLFREYKLTYKRGIILWGPPGSGKSCTIQLIMRDVVDRGGVVIKFTHPSLFLEGIRKFREIQPDTPIVVLMEDIDSIIENYSESEVLNILDGVNQVEKVVFLATTNYPEKLARIINRPSRFDKRIKISHPNAESRRMYLDFVIGGPDKVKELKIDLDQWVEDTENFSLAHLKELFTAVVILGDSYDDAIEALSLMKEDMPDSEDDEPKKQMGFLTMNKPKRRRRDSNIGGASPGGPPGDWS